MIVRTIQAIRDHVRRISADCDDAERILRRDARTGWWFRDEDASQALQARASDLEQGQPSWAHLKSHVLADYGYRVNAVKENRWLTVQRLSNFIMLVTFGFILGFALLISCEMLGIYGDASGRETFLERGLGIAPLLVPGFIVSAIVWALSKFSLFQLYRKRA